MAKSKKARKQRELGLDTHGENEGRGRPRRMRASEIYGRAGNYRTYFWKMRFDKKKDQSVRDHPWPWAEQMLAATNEDELRKAFAGAPGYVQMQFANFYPLILSIFKEKTFPKTIPAQLDYLADSLGALGEVSTRRSRDVCGIERTRARRKSPHKIIRHEYYVECSCGYKGPARDNACRKCGAEIPLFQDILWGVGMGHL